MAIQVHGQGGVVAEVDGTGFRALRVTLRPVEYGGLGAFAVATSHANIMAANLAANTEILQFRWMDSSIFGCVYLVKLIGFSCLTGFTAGFAKMDLTIARRWCLPATGGTDATMTGNNSKLRSRMQSSFVHNIQAANNGTVSPTGFKIFDDNKIGVASWSVRLFSSLLAT